MKILIRRSPETGSPSTSPRTWRSPSSRASMRAFGAGGSHRQWLGSRSTGDGRGDDLAHHGQCAQARRRGVAVMNAPFTNYVILEGDQAEERLKAIASELKAGSAIPYLGPELAELAPGRADNAGSPRRLFRHEGRLAEARQGQCLGKRPAHREHEASLNGLHAHDGSVHAEGGAYASASVFCRAGPADDRRQLV